MGAVLGMMGWAGLECGAGRVLWGGCGSLGYDGGWFGCDGMGQDWSVMQEGCCGVGGSVLGVMGWGRAGRGRRECWTRWGGGGVGCDWVAAGG